jgi:hypothetical protein
MGKTIRGKALDEVMGQLIAPFEEKDFGTREFENKKSGLTSEFDYIPYKAFFRRLNNVVGTLNYDFFVKDSQLNQVGNSYHLAVNAELRIKDDNGMDIIIRGGNGGVDLNVSPAGNCLNFKNAEQVAAQNAFINCMKFLGVGVEQLWGKKEEKKEKSAPKPQKKECMPMAGEKVIGTYHISFVQKISNMSKGYKSMVRVNELAGNERELVIWQDGVASIEKYYPMSDFQRKVCAGASMCIYGYENNFKDKEQLVMTGVCKKGGRTDEV